MKYVKKLLLLVLIKLNLLILSVNVFSQSHLDYVPPKTLLPDSTIWEIIEETSGEITFKHIMEICGYNRPFYICSSGFNQAAEYLAAKAKKFGLTDVKIEKLGKDFLWKPEEAELWLIEPENRRLVSFTEIPSCLAPHSRTCNIEAELISYELH